MNGQMDHHSSTWPLLSKQLLGPDQNPCPWLAEALRPLGLQGTLLNAILESAQQAVARAFAKKHARVNLLVFAPADELPPEQAWGFFLIEKMQPMGHDPPAAAVQVYLYLENQS